MIDTIYAHPNEPGSLKLGWGEQEEIFDRGKFFQLDHHYVNYDGKTYGGASAVLEIEEFRGARSIDNLGIFPLGYHENKEDVGGRFIKSGRKL